MNKHKLVLLLPVTLVVLFLGCQKIIHGYISDRIFYQVNPFTVLQGVTTTSSSLVVDGSTQPLHVKILALKDASGASADSLLTKPRSIVTYKGNVSYLDSTLALLNAKLSDSLVSPFNIAEIGGRLQFTAATAFVPAGTYNMDIEVSNVRGTRQLLNACAIVIVPTIADTITYQAATTSDSLGNFSSSYFLPMNISRDPVGVNKIVFKFLDKNSKPFNPAKGEVANRTGRPTFADWDPYYPEVKTDSTIEYGYPAGVPQIPIFSATVIKDGSAWSGGICYYQVVGKYTNSGLNVNAVSTQSFYVTSGTYYITYELNNVVRKPAL